jgi:hypothetical protein
LGRRSGERPSCSKEGNRRDVQPEPSFALIIQGKTILLNALLYCKQRNNKLYLRLLVGQNTFLFGAPKALESHEKRRRVLGTRTVNSALLAPLNWSLI